MASDQFSDLSTAIASAHLICVDGHGNHNKFWQGYVLPDGTLYAKYGRINYQGQTHTYPCGTVARAQTKLQRLVREKRAKGYVAAELDRVSNQTLNFAALGTQAGQIKAQIRQLEMDAEIVHQQTSIRFDPEKGQYRTDLGIITLQTIERAQTALDQVVYAQGSRNRGVLIQAIEAYIRLIPLPIGMSLNPEALLGKYTQVEHQQAALKALREGIDLITQIRIQVQQALNDQHTTQIERSFWINWGEAETIGIESDYRDTRSDCIHWN
jgi:predicted DNA-binding WGR domain protein